MTVGQLRTRIQGFMTRDAAAFLKDGQDGILSALNMSKEFAQQQVDFELSVQAFDVTIPAEGLVWTTLDGVRVKKIIALYDDEWDQIEMLTKTDPLRGLTREAIMLKGDRLFWVNAESGTVRLMAFTWLPDYTGDSDSDFLTENASTWLTYSAISHLNFYLKEDQRVQLSNAILSSSWQAVITWNETLSAWSTTTNLD